MADTASGPEEIGFLLVPRFSLMAFTAAVEPLRSANRMSGRELYRWRLFSADGEAVSASAGISFVPDAAIAEVGRCPTVFVCAGIDPHLFRDKTALSWLRQLARHGSRIGALCTGSHVLARAGLLNDYRCTIHWENLAGFAEEFPDLEVTTRLFEIDRDRLTCCGGTAALDLMLHLIAERHGHDLSTTVAEQFIHAGAHDPGDPQRLTLRRRLRVSHPKLIAVIQQMEANLEDSLTRQELAASVGLSTRQVERLFRKYLGCAPARYYLDLRLKRARLLLSQTSMSILDVSVACGFVSASHFSKCYREHFGMTPRTERLPDPRGGNGAVAGPAAP